MRAPESTVGRARALRRALSLPEVLLWQLLRGERLSGSRFRRQHPAGSDVLDFYCSDARLAVEVDGVAHDHPDRAAHDDARDRWLSGRGIAVLRFPARDLLTDAGRETVLATIAARLSAPSTALRAVPLPRSAGEEEVHLPPREALMTRMPASFQSKIESLPEAQPLRRLATQSCGFRRKTIGKR